MKMKPIALALVLGSILGVSCTSEPDVIVLQPRTTTYTSSSRKPPPTSLERDVQRASDFQAVRSWDSNN